MKWTVGAMRLGKMLLLAVPVGTNRLARSHNRAVVAVGEAGAR